MRTLVKGHKIPPSIQKILSRIRKPSKIQAKKAKLKKSAKIAKNKEIIKKDDQKTEKKNRILFTDEAIESIQEYAESYITKLLNHAGYVALHARRTKLFPSDIRTAQIIRGEIPIELPLQDLNLEKYKIDE